MKDIAYKWYDGKNSVRINSAIYLPQFMVLGTRHRIVEASLGTGDGIYRIRLRAKKKNISTHFFTRTTGNYSHLVVEMLKSSSIDPWDIPLFR